MRCLVCHRAKCKWVDLNVKTATTERIEKVLKHNTGYIDMLGRSGSLSAHGEERMFSALVPLTEELERRNNLARKHTRSFQKEKEMKVDQVRTQFGKKFKAVREAAGLAQVDVSKKLGFSTPQFISNVERGRCSMPAKHYPKLAKMFGRKATTELANLDVEVRTTIFKRVALK